MIGSVLGQAVLQLADVPLQRQDPVVHLLQPRRLVHAKVRLVLGAEIGVIG